MPAAKNPSSRPAASQKSQKSISSFFQPKSTPTSTSQSTTTASQSTRTASQTAGTASQPTITEHHAQSPAKNNDHNIDIAENSDGESDVVVYGGRSSSKRPSDYQASPSNEEEDQENSPPQAKRLKTLVTGKPKLQSTLSGESVERTANTTASLPTKAAPLAASERTSRYVFSDQHNDRAYSPEPEEVIRQKQKLHQRFVKKLGRPDSIAEIKRRNHFIEDATGGDGDLAEEDDAEEEIQPKGKKLPNVKKGAKQLTPMEKQIIEIKRKNMDAVIVIEVGYKFRFFGEDARTAAKELSIVCIPGKFRFDEHPSEAHLDRFASASIPVHRLHFHVKRLVAAGHKVGVVRQLETAALKAAGDNRNAPFVRKLTNVYTKGTYIDDIEGLEEPSTGPSGGAPATGHLLCLTETNAKGWGTDEKVQVGLIAVQPATGDIIYDNFEDGFMRSEVETRLLHIAPCEFLLVGELSKATEKLVQHLSGSKTNVFGDKARVERVDKPKTMAAQSYNHIANFYADKLKSNNTEDLTSAKILDKVHNLSENVVVCLSAMITHLKEYGLEHVFDLTKNFQAFSARSHMLLNGNTLTSLEIYQNQTNHSEKGSLLWVLNQTKTRFGQRLLRKWVGRPLLDREKLEERITAVEELRNGDSTASVEKLNATLSKSKADLEKSLIRIYYGKCSRSELLNFLQTMQRIATEYAHVQSHSDTGFESLLLSDSIASLPKILETVIEYLEQIDAEAAKSNDKYTFFREEHETDAISAQKAGIASVQQDLTDYRKVAAEKLKKMSVDYVTVAGIDYLIEVENTQLKSVPASWAKISGTKKVSRFHAPEVVKFVRERDQHKETLAAACDDAFASLLADIATNYQLFRDCIQSLATLDCLLSLAEVASRPGYVKPSFTSDTQVKVSAGRHPMVEQLLLDSYVPNDIDLDTSKTRALLITGPNMGGKSSFVRQVALISIMGQIGSYVPAASAELGMLDAVFTRMGAFDNMMAGESTFMVELSETSDILKQATPRSLIILDELGRGTSTHDGVAIAHAVLDYIVRETRSLLLFITHYQSMSAVAKTFPVNELKNMHMRFTESGEEVEDITFLYELGEGTAHRSYGLNVARLANVPDSVTEVAAVKSKELETNMQNSTLSNIAQSLYNLADDNVGDFDALVSRIEEL